MFCRKNLGLLDYFDAWRLNVLQTFILRIYVNRMLYFEKINFEKYILLEGVGLMTFCYTLESFMSLGDFDFIKLV